MGDKWTEKRRAAHYTAMAEAAKNQNMFPGKGGGSKPPKGCLSKLLGLGVCVAVAGGLVTAVADHLTTQRGGKHAVVEVLGSEQEAR